ncbi:hypothetical protein OU997_14525 [Pseudomonas sp. SL4(2022)]|uniref:hypothetical protein n=1 Tax=Pseudomonas sp. SL4(2022) TaxID=2994661 RepID=UPI00226ECBDA|nr:hypothetical protein [Pseudomonas sp. SL4(2022)]WAC43480.1 hypothetical protein OU997_14525 [Pseudomonas sp. SL4(2022)]
MTALIARKYRATTANLLRCTIVLGLASAISACNSAESEVQKVVIDNLLVRDVYKFGEFTEVNGLGACQTVNSVTADGRDTGDMQAFVIKKDGAWHFGRFVSSTHEECVTAVEELTDEILANQG